MAEHIDPSAPLVAETGGLNAMIVDSTALHEQAVRDILQSAFQSAGQRCSALRCLYVQDDIAGEFLPMLFGAMDALHPADPWHLSSDFGPVIDAEAQQAIRDHVGRARAEGRLLHECAVPEAGFFVAPSVIAVPGIGALEREVFGPVLHVARFRAEDLGRVVEDINATGYGLTFGLHTRIDDRVQTVVERIRVGNIYVNRNQIGAVVGSQPFGGEGLSGTGPKAGGPDYLHRFTRAGVPALPAGEAPETPRDLQAALSAAARNGEVAVRDMPGPTGESNRLSHHARPPLLCLGPGAAASAQKQAVEAMGGCAVAAPDLPPERLAALHGFGGALWWGGAAQARAYLVALARREGPILPLVTGRPARADVLLERHLCIDTTASGGNADLLAAQT